MQKRKDYTLPWIVLIEEKIKEWAEEKKVKDDDVVELIDIIKDELINEYEYLYGQMDQYHQDRVW